MALIRLEREGRQLIIHAEAVVCTTTRAIIQSEEFDFMVGLYADLLRARRAPEIEPFLPLLEGDRDGSRVAEILRTLVENPLERVAKGIAGLEAFLQPENRRALHAFVEGLYDFWRSFDRYMVLHSEPGPSSFDRRPYRAFNDTIETLADLVRAVYRDACENITGDHPRIYRQVPAGCNVGLIAVPRTCALPPAFASILDGIPVIRQAWLVPPMLIDPPMNKRTGAFIRVAENPIAGLSLRPREWLCYPARVGPLRIFIYFHQRFIGLGCSLSNLFELASDEQVALGPDAIYLYGLPPESLARFGPLPTVFHEDEESGVIIGAVPWDDRFGYFGYLKKMTLTLHNAVMMKRGRMPFHGAMVRLRLGDGAPAFAVIIGDTATGKSESLEALRILGEGRIRELRVIADDMGSLEVREDGTVAGYGTEIGAFVRLDDLRQGYAFQQMDRAIFMSPQKVNARVVLPVTTLEEVLHGWPIDYLLYANNYEQVDADHPVLEPFASPERALAVFREGAAMAKGTTTATGLGHSYFANIFGPPQYRDLHERLAARTFEAAFRSGVFVGQLRTRLGIPGFETKGPEEAARALFAAIEARGPAGPDGRR
ncbi:MAG: phosphoenolpyruvate carboxykinase [Planctomycetes bacterium]|nr:phosphoenolpyruvate carboxykinase [Planctomycetota bacterium]